jgi:hypothetical protein
MTRRWLQPFLIAFLLAPGLVPGLAAPAAGQSVLLLDEQASFCAMVQALSPTRPARCQERPRSIVFRPPVGTDTAAADTAARPGGTHICLYDLHSVCLGLRPARPGGA